MSPPSRGETPASIVTTKITHATLFNILFPAITSPFNKELDGPAVVKNDARILSRSLSKCRTIVNARAGRLAKTRQEVLAPAPDRKSTRLNSSHSQISYAVFCLKK